MDTKAIIEIRHDSLPGDATAGALVDLLNMYLPGSFAVTDITAEHKELEEFSEMYADMVPR